MATEPKVPTEPKIVDGIVFLNRSKRKFDLGFTADAKGNKAPRIHMPGATMLYTREEAERMSIYKELIDISKLPGQVDARKLKSENAKLVEENAKLKSQLAALPVEAK